MSRPIFVAGGGTGGHVFVADAVARALVEDGVDPADLRFVGSTRGQERELLAGRGIELTLLPGRGILRSLRPRAILRNLGSSLGILLALLGALALTARQRPRAVVSVGGYAAAPAGIAAVLLRRPLILVNVDAVPGLAHRLLGRFAAASCVAFPGTPLPRSVVTGAPVRPEFLSVAGDPGSRRAAKLALGCDPDRPLVAVLTGSLGARSVNAAVLELADRWRGRGATLYQVSGRRDFEDFEAMVSSRPAGVLDHRLVPFEADVPSLYGAADVAVTRAGALTVAELAVCGLPAVLVPLPGAPGDHQTRNAEALVSAGGGILLADRDLSGSRLDDLLSALLDDESALDSMATAARVLGHPDAAGEVAEVVLDRAR